MSASVYRDLIVVGASAGGVESLRAMVAGFPPDLNAAVLVVLHVPRSAASALPAILDRSGPLPARHAIDGERPRPERIYVAPPDRHLLLLDGRLRLSGGPAENGHRPAVDPLFRSAARCWPQRAIGVVLSGARDDGAAGLAALVERGGIAVVQDPTDALHPSMPLAALELVIPQVVCPATKLGGVLAELVGAPAEDRSEPTDDDALDAEVEMSQLRDVGPDRLQGEAAGYGCPDCGGALFEIQDGPLPRYRCRVGHAWSSESLLDAHSIALEGALWMALRALEEKSALSARMAQGRLARGHTGTAERYQAIAEEANRAGGLIRDLITTIGSAGDPIAGTTPPS